MKYSNKLICFLSIFSSSFLCSCSKCNDDEVWRETIELSDGSHVTMYHTHQCTKEKPFFCPKDKIMDFVQMKFDVFDYCFSEDEIQILVAISIRNIKKREQYFFPEEASDFENQDRFMSVADTSYHPYECYYSLQGKSLIHLTEPFIP